MINYAAEMASRIIGTYGQRISHAQVVADSSNTIAYLGGQGRSKSPSLSQYMVGMMENKALSPITFTFEHVPRVVSKHPDAMATLASKAAKQLWN